MGAARVVALLLFPLYVALTLLDANAATATAAGLALIGAVWTLHHANATARRTLTSEYRARWDHPDLVEARVITSDFLDCPEAEQDERWSKWTTDMDKRERLQITSVINFWEEVATAFNQGYLDWGWFCTDFAWVLEHNWRRAAWFVRKSREEAQDAKICSAWQAAYETVEPDLRRQHEEGKALVLEALERGEDLLSAPQR